METTNDIALDNPYGYIKNGKIILKAFLQFPEREIGIVKDSDAQALTYFEKRFSLFEQKVNSLFDAISSAENKGSYLQKLLYLKDQCGEFDALGDFSSIYQKLIEKEAELNVLVVKNRNKNLSLKKAIIQELELIKDSSDWINASEQIKEIKNKWLRIGSVEKEFEEELESQFKNLLDIFFERRQEFYDERRKFTEAKLAKYQSLADRVVALKDSSDTKKMFFELKKLKEEWKEVGIVPKKDLTPIMDVFKDTVKQIQRKLKANQRPRPFDPNAAPDPRLASHLALLAQVEEILKEMPFAGDDQVRKIFDEWKKLGPVRGVYEFKALDERFKRKCARTLDLYYLNRQVVRRQPNFKLLSPKEQIKLKIAIMKDMVNRDKENIENFENSFSQQATNSQDNNFDKVFGSKLLIQKRNLESKQQILRELEDQLQFV